MIGYGSQCARPWARVQAADLGLRPWRSVSLSPLLLIAPAFAGACVMLHDHHHDHERPARSSQRLFVRHLPACWGVHSKFPRLPKRAGQRCSSRAASAEQAEDARGALVA